jgi:ubiquinone/menaquinone biosynthesis C-methylase UbiE
VTVEKTTSGFEGLVGRISGPVMARLNRDMERTAVAELNPSPLDSVLAIGFGPGIGVESLADVLSAGSVAGIDPSAAMNELARRRNRRGIDSGRIVLRNAGAEAIPWPDNTFNGIVAVNSAQLWRPLNTAVGEVARVIRPGGSLVTITHTWAIEKTSPVPEWIERRSSLFAERELSAISSRIQKFRSGCGLILRATALGEEVAGHDLR